MFKVGLTGGIGCGKTTIANQFAARDVPVIDADAIARRLVDAGQPAFHAIVEHFGSPVLTPDGQLDRGGLRQRIFAQPEERLWLERLLHPLVYAELQHAVDEAQAAYCVLVIPLLLETGQRNFVDRVLVVDCLPAVQKARVKGRDGLDDAAVVRILAAQLSRAERLAAADDVLENNADIANLLPQLERLHQRYLGLAAHAAQTRRP